MHMKALVTGASSGIGESIARYLHDMGFDLILVSRNLEKLEKLKKEFGRKTKVIDMDLSSTYNCMSLYEMCKDLKIDCIINNAGFGDCGFFLETSLDKELNMIDLNIKCVQILTKMFLNDFLKHNRGYILNVASMAAFSPGPLMATYYATKNYCLNLTEGISEELRQMGSNVYIGCLCPGPVDTNFNKVAGGEFKIDALSSDEVVRYALKQCFKNKLIIVPGITVKMGLFFNRLVTHKFSLKIVYNIQDKKMRRKKNV